MRRHHLHFSIVAGLAMAASIAGCTPDRTDTTAPASMSAEPDAPAPPPAMSAPAEIPAGQAVVTLKSAGDMKVSGDLTLTAETGGVHVSGSISGLTRGTQHGFHIHESGDCSAADFKSAGGHFNPSNKEHGNPNSDIHHAGDMMNLTVNDSGIATLDVTVPGVTLGDGGSDDVMNRAIVIHSGPDDYTSQPAGDSGSRIACGVIAK